MPMGGSVTACSMLFVALTGWFFGPRVGVTAALAYGLMQLIFDAYIVHPIQLILDYPLAFACLGITGLFKDYKNGLIIGYLIGVTGRLICSIASGIVFFGEYAADAGFNNIPLYSFVYNFTYMAPEAVITVGVLLVPAVANALDKIRAQAAR